MVTAQVKVVHSLLGQVIRGLAQGLLLQALTEGQGCALVQAMHCLVNLVKQQPRSKQAHTAAPCFT